MLTVIYYTAHFPKERFAENIREQLLQSIGKLPLVSVSHRPLDFGKNICVDMEPSTITVYKQVLVGAKEAGTEYVVLAEDDTLYPPQHFRVKLNPNVFAYNLNKWTLATYRPVYAMNRRRTNSCLIAPRELLIEAIEERLDKFDSDAKQFKWLGEPGRDFYERKLGITIRQAIEFYTSEPIITFYHPQGLGYSRLGKKKQLGKVRAFDLPYWGRAEEIIKLWT